MNKAETTQTKQIIWINPQMITGAEFKKTLTPILRYMVGILGYLYPR